MTPHTPRSYKQVPPRTRGPRPRIFTASHKCVSITCSHLQSVKLGSLYGEHSSRSGFSCSTARHLLTVLPLTMSRAKHVENLTLKSLIFRRLGQRVIVLRAGSCHDIERRNGEVHVDLGRLSSPARWEPW